MALRFEELQEFLADFGGLSWRGYWGGLLFCDASDGRRKAWQLAAGFVDFDPRRCKRAGKSVVIDYTGSLSDRWGPATGAECARSDHGRIKPE